MRGCHPCFSRDLSHPIVKLIDWPLCKFLQFLKAKFWGLTGLRSNTFFIHSWMLPSNILDQLSD
ncbi:hypothetical protein CICLE_v10017425mg [Citrus x clementina]|uniref:Uncharacterized protein n=1 Tax=Citrus clementina TaxID=85681 RepID=V4W635_CITCL|nr:hypothetical protein CICLE_v10017425mg [Citrus x clementina]